MRPALGALALCCMFIAACKYDTDDRCGPRQTMRDGLCACVAGTNLKEGQCVAAASPVAGNSGGGAGGTPGADAGAGGAGLGSACSMDADCTEAPNTKCVTKNASSGYCSRTDCEDDCDAGYFCATDESPSYCKRMPTGQDSSCTTPADCAGQDASFCVQTPTGDSKCVVPGCMPGGCSPGFSDCFNLAMIEPNAPFICVPPS